MSHRARTGQEKEEEDEEGAARGSRARPKSHAEAAASGGRSQERHERKRKRQEAQQLQKLQHLESFYEKPPPGLIKENETKPEDCIPDVPGNESAREFLAHAPTKGLWMPLGKEVKVMQCKAGKIPDVAGLSCSHYSGGGWNVWWPDDEVQVEWHHDAVKATGWRCKRYGHRTGDKECPFFIKGNQKLEQFRVAHEDPMYDIIRENKRHEKEMRIQQLKQLLEDSTSDDDDNSDDEDGSSSTSSECRDKHKKKKRKKEKKKKEKKKKKKKKRKSLKSNEKSESD